MTTGNFHGRSARSCRFTFAACGVLVSFLGGLPIMGDHPPSKTRVDELALLGLFLRYDSALTGDAQERAARDAAREYLELLGQCEADADRPQDMPACLLERILGPNGFRSSSDPSAPRANTLTAALAQRQGSCAALVAAVLALTEGLGEPFNAVILRDHVLLESASSPAVSYEVLDGGRRLTQSDILKHQPQPSGGPIRVSGTGYVAYYLDNLGARFAEAGEASFAEEAFLEALDVGPKAARIHYNYGTFLLGEERYEEAAEHLDRAIRLGWKDADAYVNRGGARWKLGRTKAARRDFNKALELDPSNRAALANLRRVDEARASHP